MIVFFDCKTSEIDRAISARIPFIQIKKAAIIKLSFGRKENIYDSRTKNQNVSFD